MSQGHYPTSPGEFMRHVASTGERVVVSNGGGGNIDIWANEEFPWKDYVFIRQSGDAMRSAYPEQINLTLLQAQGLRDYLSGVLKARGWE